MVQTVCVLLDDAAEEQLVAIAVALAAVIAF